MTRAAIFFSLAYLCTIPLQPYPLQIAAKMLPCLCLAAACYQLLSGKTRLLMVSATLLSATADGAIEFSFLAGLATFLLVQLTYTITFARNRRPWNERTWLLGLTVLFLLGALVLLAPRAGDMAIGVGVYMIAICLMVMSAAVYRGSALVILGAASFLVSDTLIGVNRFWVAVPLEEYAVMSTYYAGQVMIVLGVIRTEGKTP